MTTPEGSTHIEEEFLDENGEKCLLATEDLLEQLERTYKFEAVKQLNPPKTEKVS